MYYNKVKNEGIILPFVLNKTPHTLTRAIDKQIVKLPPEDYCCKVQHCILSPCPVSERQAYKVTSIFFQDDLEATVSLPNNTKTARKSKEDWNKRLFSGRI